MEGEGRGLWPEDCAGWRWVEREKEECVYVEVNKKRKEGSWSAKENVLTGLMSPVKAGWLSLVGRWVKWKYSWKSKDYVSFGEDSRPLV